MPKPTQTRLLSVCIPTYEMGGVGHQFLKQSLDVLATQTFRDFDVVISDFSPDDKIKKLCQTYQKQLEINYFKNTNPVKGIATNTNNVIQKATGQLLKILYQDDLLTGPDALAEIVANFDLEKDWWLVTGCLHTEDGRTFNRPHYPHYNHQLYLGNNTIGSPSVLTIKNDAPLLMDLNLRWLVDCDYYRRYYEGFGAPKIVRQTPTAIRTHEQQITNTEATNELREREQAYMLKKYPAKTGGKLQLPNVALVTVSGIDPSGGVKALELSMEGIDFGQAIVIAHQKPANLPKGITFKQCQPSELKSQDRSNTDDYSRFMAYDLWKYVDSDYVLIVHNDAYVLRPEAWTNVFLEFDYVGPPWPKNVHFAPDGTNVRVGNGGFSLRSRRMLKSLHDLKLPFTDNGTGYYHEDGIICVYYRRELEQAGLRFAPVPVAARFGLEKNCPDSYYQPFGFHNNQRAISWLSWLRQGIRTRYKNYRRHRVELQEKPTPERKVMKQYTNNHYRQLRYPFNGAEAISKNYSQAYQDMFALTMLNGKKNGTYVEIGAFEPIFISNTYLLEHDFGWKGVSVDVEERLVKLFAKKRTNPLILDDALAVDYAKLFATQGFGKQIDYLSIDIEPKTQTLECLKKLPHDKYRFSVITYETDYYDDSEGRAVAEKVRTESRRFLKSLGYRLIAGNIANTSPDDIFEDWYVDPKAIDPKILRALKQVGDFNDTAEKFMLQD